MKRELTGVKPGDTLIRLRRNDKPHSVTVAKVGRTLVHVYQGDGSYRMSDSTDAYYIRDGRDRSGDGFSALYLPDVWAEVQRRDELLTAIARDHGVSMGYRAHLTSDQLERILAILKEDT